MKELTLKARMSRTDLDRLDRFCEAHGYTRSGFLRMVVAALDSYPARQVLQDWVADLPTQDGQEVA